MAFESFVAAADPGSARKRRLSVGAVALVQGGLLAFAVVHSYWHVDELAPPMVIISWPTVPPPMTARGGGGRSEKRRPEQVPHKKLTLAKVEPAIVQPTEVKPAEPAVEPATDVPVGPASDGTGGQGTGGTGTGGPDGIGDGTGGPGGGTGNGPPTPAPVDPPAPVRLPPTVAAAQALLSPPPHLPEPLRRLGVEYAVLAKICVSAAGAVTSVTILRGAHPDLDREVIDVVSTWRYRAFTIGGHPVPFCTVARFTFSTR